MSSTSPIAQLPAATPTATVTARRFLAQVSFAGAECRRPFLAIGDGSDTARTDARRDEVVLYRRRPTFAEGEIVLARAALVGMALDGDRDGAAPQEHRGLPIERALGLTSSE